MAQHLSAGERPADERVMDRRDFIKIGTGAGAALLAEATVLPASALSDPQSVAQRNRATAGAGGGSIDAHAHWVPESYAQALMELGHPTTSIHSPLEVNVNLDQRVQWMDARGIQMHVLTLDGGMPWQWASPADGAHLAQLVNDAAVEAHLKYPTRFIAGIEMPIRDPELALQELNRMAGKPGMRAIHLPNSIANSDFLFQPGYESLWARCEQLGYPVLFHPMDGEENIYGGKERLGNPLAASANLGNTLGFPFESATTAAKFIITGTLDKFPSLEILLPHSGGCFPYVAGRIERGLAAKKFKLQRPFREYIRRFHYDSITYYPETLRFLIALAGSDRVVIGSDDYAPMDVEEPTAPIEQLNLPAQDRDLILHGNAKRLFRL
jgi:aminocarboxymuconate-semialdehyde decarboxylase